MTFVRWSHNDVMCQWELRNQAGRVWAWITDELICGSDQVCLAVSIQARTGSVPPPLLAALASV